MNKDKALADWFHNLNTPNSTDICSVCKKTLDDEPGAWFGDGKICPECGYYRKDVNENPKNLS